MTAGFTVDITGTQGMRTGEWAQGEEFAILPDRRLQQRQEEDGGHRVRLYAPDDPAVAGSGSGGGTATLVKVAAGRPQASGPVTVAEVEERTRGGYGTPHPVLVLHDPAGRPTATVRPEEPGVTAPRHFTVTDAEGLPLCRITHGPSRIGRRGYWRIDFPDGRPPLTGRRGTWAGWLGFVLLLPLWVTFFIGSVLVTLLTLGHVGEMLVWGCPKNVVWRRDRTLPGRGRAMTFSYMRTGYRFDAALLEERIAHSQAALHYFTKMHTD
ncbi:hypothetical protein ACFV0Z_13665 [Streptomyces xiamenensis]|uniref:hypothetical protein n=1 Tax=Streptomyces xiamenensis TaxID=408015 RepID=UPI0036B2C639